MLDLSENDTIKAISCLNRIGRRTRNCHCLSP